MAVLYGPPGKSFGLGVWSRKAYGSRAVPHLPGELRKLQFYQWLADVLKTVSWPVFKLAPALSDRSAITATGSPGNLTPVPMFGRGITRGHPESQRGLSYIGGKILSNLPADV